jgi:hypothetical protein
MKAHSKLQVQQTSLPNQLHPLCRPVAVEALPVLLVELALQAVLFRRLPRILVKVSVAKLVAAGLVLEKHGIPA